jgi:hypothetical protein
MEIRHLKDRMIRKCMRLATPPGAQTHAQAADVTFRTVYAPPDFRLKEMEKYLKTHETGKRPKNDAHHGGHANDALSPPPADAYMRSPQSASPRSPAALARSPIRSPLESGHRPLSPVTYRDSLAGGETPNFPVPEPASPLDIIEQPPSGSAFTPDGMGGIDINAGGLSPLPDPFAQAPPPEGTEHTASPGQFYTDGRPTLSPEPLPHPYRGSQLFSPEAGVFASFGDLALAASPAPAAPPQPIPSPALPPLPEEAVEASETDAVGPLPDRPLVRRRSSLKRRDSASRLSINGSVRGVSFAMDLSRTEMVARDVEIAGVTFSLILTFFFFPTCSTGLS